jgi:hypothetical protein
MDSDSPKNARIAGQPTLEFGGRFTPGNTCAFTPWTGRALVGADTGGRSGGHRRSSASYRVSHGYGHHP